MGNLLLDGASQLGLNLSEAQQGQLTAYLVLLRKWNRVYNLTSISDPDKMIVHHLLDSLVLVKYFQSAGQKIIDIGTGAGLPGIPLSILLPENHFTLLDSNGKKTRFLTQVKIELGLANSRVVNHRVQEYLPEHLYDRVVSRAFSSIRSFVESSEHLISKQGRFLAMKAKFPGKELEELPERFKIDNSVELQVPFLGKQRHLIALALT